MAVNERADVSIPVHPDVAKLVNDLKSVRRRGRVRQFTGEPDPHLYNHVLVLKAYIEAHERGADISIITSPIVLVEPSVETTMLFTGPGSMRLFKSFDQWLSPLVEHNLLETELKGHSRTLPGRYTIRGFDTTVRSAVDVFKSLDSTHVNQKPSTKAPVCII